MQNGYLIQLGTKELEFVLNYVHDDDDKVDAATRMMNCKTTAIVLRTTTAANQMG
jgi:hypothetical protein